RVQCFAWSRDGKTMASFGDDHAVRVWDVAEGKGRMIAQAPKPVSRVLISRDGKRVAREEGYGALAIYDLGKAADACVSRGRNQTAAAFAPDGKTIAYANIHEVRLGDLETCESRALYSHAAWIQSVAFSADGKYLASGGLDKMVGLYDVAAG